MATYLLVVPSAAKDGRDAEYNDWYDSRHLQELCALPGVTSGRRFEAAPQSPHAPALPYLAIYEVETDDPAALLQEMARRSASGEISRSDAVDAEAARLWLYKAR